MHKIRRLDWDSNWLKQHDEVWEYTLMGAKSF